jgi:phage terminase large subunit
MFDYMFAIIPNPINFPPENIINPNTCFHFKLKIKMFFIYFIKADHQTDHLLKHVQKQTIKQTTKQTTKQPTKQTTNQPDH